MSMDIGVGYQKFGRRGRISFSRKKKIPLGVHVSLHKDKCTFFLLQIERKSKEWETLLLTGMVTPL